MPLQPAHLWLLAGAFFLAIEVLGASGIGFLFAGLAAIVTAIVIESGLISNAQPLLHLGCFFALTALFAALLWKRLTHFRSSTKGGYSNMIGDVALVGKGGLVVGVTGQVSWSGTTMMAEISPKSEETSFAQGAAVEIVDVKGNVLIVVARR